MLTLPDGFLYLPLASITGQRRVHSGCVEDIVAGGAVMRVPEIHIPFTAKVFHPLRMGVVPSGE